MHEILHIRQYEGEHRRRWFQDAQMDLCVWFEDDDNFFGFQLCYNVPFDTHALTWSKDKGYRHHGVDDDKKMTPVLLLDGEFNYKKIAEVFLEKSQKIPEDIAAFVHGKLLEYPRNGD